MVLPIKFQEEEMLISMTGFGKGEAKSRKYRFEVEVKSLNSRFLDVRIKSPKEFFTADIEVQEVVKRYIKRGRVEFNYKIEALPEIEESINVDESRLVTIYEVLSEIKESLDLDEEVSLDQVLSFREFFLQEDTEWDKEDKEAFLTAADIAVRNLVEMRKKEGKHLEKDITKRLKNLEMSVNQIEEIYNKEKDKIRDNLLEKLSSLLGQSVDKGRLEEEIFYYWERLDISEELVRLKSHIKQFFDSLGTKEPVGRKLDFLTQELVREANTIASKSINNEIVSKVVELKTEVEKIKEQVQNVE